MTDPAVLSPAIISFDPSNQAQLIADDAAVNISEVMHELDLDVQNLTFPWSSSNNDSSAKARDNSTAAVQLNQTLGVLKHRAWKSFNFCANSTTSNTTSNNTNTNTTSNNNNTTSNKTTNATRVNVTGKGWCAEANRKGYWEGMNVTLQHAIRQLAKVQNNSAINGSILAENRQNLTALNLTLGRIQTNLNLLAMSEAKNSTKSYYADNPVAKVSAAHSSSSETGPVKAAIVKDTASNNNSFPLAPVVILGVALLVVGAIFFSKHFKEVRERIRISNSRYSELDRANVFSSPKQAEKGGLLVDEEMNGGGGGGGYELVSVQAVE